MANVQTDTYYWENGQYSGNMYLKAELTATANINTGKYNVYYKIIGGGAAAYSYAYLHRVSLSVGGVNRYYNDDVNIQVTNETFVADGNFVIDPGKYNIELSGGYINKNVTNINGSNEITLADIPRYTNVSISQKSKDINSISINWTSDDARDHTQYRIKEGSSNYSGWIDARDTVASDNKSGHFKISNLKPNTNYKIQVQVKRTDSQLWSSSNELAITTYDYAKFVSVSNADFGENAIISKSNESGITDRLEIYADNSLIATRTNIDMSYNLILTQNELDNLYKKYAVNSSSVNVEYRLITICNSKTYTHTITRTISLTGNAKTAKIKQNGVIKRAKVFIKQNGVVKKGVLFVKQDGTIKRCI